MDSDAKNEYSVQFRKGTKGPKLVFGGYSYFRNNGNAGRTYWLCSRNRYQKCKARLITKSNTRELVVKNQIHNHPPDPDGVDTLVEEVLCFDQVIGYLKEIGSGKDKDWICSAYIEEDTKIAPLFNTKYIFPISSNCLLYFDAVGKFVELRSNLF